ncbi:hypothetical protein HS088_TW14G01171 [Tripterygium wilfordii]|uniref:Uncharacterized protein n=1 Tax=Tripterygium wilfordii TaxID=458696 RepID=A0A7J7CSD2_TRIWF|nr:hypothetical protein HS088_TW14G01171 [Tripterygium wilfordii]
MAAHLPRNNGARKVQELEKIVADGFDVIDGFNGNPGRAPGGANAHVFIVKEKPVIPRDRPEINCDQAAKKYGGMIIKDHRPRR